MGWIKRKPKTEAQQSKLQVELNRIQKEIDTLWNKLTPGEQIFAPILVLNVIIYGLWRAPTLRPFMLKYFCSNPAAKAVCWPMLLSTFSHYSLFHLFANMYVLHSFSAAANGLGREQFLGLYLSAGVISSFASYAFKVATANPGFSLGAVSQLKSYVVQYFNLLSSVRRDHGHSRLRLRSLSRHKAVDSFHTTASVLGAKCNLCDNGVRCFGSDLQVEALRPCCSSWWRYDGSLLEFIWTRQFVAASWTPRRPLAWFSRKTTEMMNGSRTRLDDLAKHLILIYLLRRRIIKKDFKLQSRLIEKWVCVILA